MQQAPLFQYQGLVAGVDEAGRGPLAGPVVAAAVILPTGHGIRGLDDSKKLSASRRESLAADVRAAALSCSVAWADAAEIDAMNILAATMLAMRRAILGLAVTPGAIQVDGNRLPKVVIEGDDTWRVKRLSAVTAASSRSPRLRSWPRPRGTGSWRTSTGSTPSTNLRNIRVMGR
jgi:ribonuclease HII